jgi:hypothetical protein
MRMLQNETIMKKLNVYVNVTQHKIRWQQINVYVNVTNKIIMKKCLCECYKQDNNEEMFMWMLNIKVIMNKCSCGCYITR